jgi:hypothetical protein
MLSLRKSLLLILTIFSSTKLFAQYPGMKQVYGQMFRENFNAQMRLAMNANNYRWGNATAENFSYTFTVIMKDGLKKEVTSRIYHNKSLNKNYLLLGEDTSGQKIYPEQTNYIARMDSDNNVAHKHFITGIPNDSCWMFKVIIGTIAAYSYLSERDESDFFDPSTIIGLQYGDGAILALNSDNLKKMVSKDKDAMKYFDKKDYYKALTRYNKDNQSQ